MDRERQMYGEESWEHLLQWRKQVQLAKESPPLEPQQSAEDKEKKTPPSRASHLDSQGVMHLDITVSDKELKLFEPLGEGSYGVVYRGEWQEQPVAVKRLKIHMIDELAIKQLRQEAEIMFRMGLDSKYIVPLKRICLEAPHYSLVMELMPLGSLYQLLKNRSDLPWPIRFQIALDISYGLRDLHARKILHRDLKSLNVLLYGNFHAKLADLGLAKIMQEMETHSSEAKGTPSWMAPELFNGGSMTESSDVYSLGMVFWELASCQIPFAQTHDRQVIIGWIMSGKQEHIPTDCPPELRTLIERCWKLPAQRPTAVQIVDYLKPLVITEGKEKLPALSESKLRIVPQVTLPPVEGKAVYPRVLQVTTEKLTARLPDLAFYLPPTVIKTLPEGMNVEELMAQLNAIPDKKIGSTEEKDPPIVAKKENQDEKDEKKGIPKASPEIHQSTASPGSRLLTCHEVAAVIDTFLAQEENLLLLLGEPGAGKSLTTWETVRRLLAESEETKLGNLPQNPAWLPLPVELNQLTVSQLPGLIERELKAAGLSEAGIRQLQQPPSEQKPVPKLLLIMDGYDELRQGSGSHRDHADLFKTIGGEAWTVGQLKVLVTCRRNFLNSLPEEEMIFGVGHYQRYQRYELLPFTLRQIESYIQTRSQNDVGGGLLKPKAYLQLLQSSESLRQVVQNPFVLHLFLEALPGLSQTGTVSMQELVRFDLYTAFFDQWLKREVRRLPNITKAALGRKDHATLVQDFKRMAMVVAYQMFVANSLWVRVDPMSSHSPATAVWMAALEQIALGAKLEYQQLGERSKHSIGTLFGSLTGSQPSVPTEEAFMQQAQRRAEQLIHVLPVTRSGSEYRFVHKSLYEYLLAEGLLTLTESKTPLAGSVFTCFNQRPIQTEPEVVYLLNEWLKKPAQTKQREALINTGRHLIERSKEDEKIAQASANAMTLLNALHVSFAYADLRGVRIPGADMGQGLFDHTDFRQADLTDVNFQDAYLSHAKLARAKTKGLYLQEDVVMEWKLRENQIAKSPDGLWLVFCGSDKHPASAYLYSVAEKRVVTPQGIGERIAQAVFSNDGRCLALCGDETYKSPSYVYKYADTEWRLATPEKGVGSHIRYVQFSDDSRWLIISPLKGRYQITDCQMDHLDWIVIDVESTDCKKMFSSDNRWLFFEQTNYSSWIRKLHVWICEDKYWKAVTPEQGLEHSKFQCSVNNRWLVLQQRADSKDPDVLFSCREGTLQPMTFKALGKPIRKIQISDDGQGLMFRTDEQNVVYLANGADEKLKLEAVKWTAELKSKIINDEEVTPKLCRVHFPTPHWVIAEYEYYSKTGKHCTASNSDFNVYLIKQENEWKTIAHKTLSGETGRYSPNGRWLAVFYHGASLISLKDYCEVSLPLSIHAGAAQFSPDSQWLIFYKCGGPAYLLVYRNEQWELVANLGDGEKNVTKAHFSAEGRWLFIYVADGTYSDTLYRLIIGDLQLGKEHTFSLALDIPFRAVLLLPDNIHWLLAAGSRCYVGKIGQAGLQCLLELSSPIMELHCLAGSEYISIQTEDGITVVKDWLRLLSPLQQGLLIKKDKREIGQTLSLLTITAPWVMTGGKEVNTILWRFNGSLDYVTGLSGQTREIVHPCSKHLWIAAQTGLYVLSPAGLGDNTPENWQQIWDQQLWLRFSEDGQWLVLENYPNFIKLLKCADGKPQEWMPSAECSQYRKWEFSPDQQWLVMVNRDGNIHLLACKVKHPQWKILKWAYTTDYSDIPIKFSANSRWLVVVDRKNPIDIYDLHRLDWVTPEECKSMTEILKVEFSPDSCWLVLLSKKITYLLNCKNKQSKWTLTAEYKDIEAKMAQFSNDSRWLVLHSNDDLSYDYTHDYITPTRILDCREDKPKWVTHKGWVGQNNSIVFSTDNLVLGLHTTLRNSEGSGILALNGPEPYWVATQESVGAGIERLVFSPDGHWMVAIFEKQSTQGHYGALFGYKNNQWQLLQKIKSSFHDGVFSSDNLYLVLHGTYYEKSSTPAYIAHIIGDEGKWKSVTPEQGLGQNIRSVDFSNDQRWILLIDEPPRSYVFWCTLHCSLALSHSLELQLTLYRGATIFHNSSSCMLFFDRPALYLVSELPALSERESQPYAVYVYSQKITEGISNKTNWHLTYFSERLAGGGSLTVVNESITDPLLITALDAAKGDRDKLTVQQQEQLLTKVPDYDRIFVRYLLANVVIRDVKIFNQHYVAMICGDGSLRLWDLRDPRRPALCAATSMSAYTQSVGVNEAVELSEFNRQLLTKSSDEYRDRTYKIENGQLIEEKEIESKMTVAPEQKVEVKTSPKETKRVDSPPTETKREQKAFSPPKGKIESPPQALPSHGKESKIAAQPETVSSFKQKLINLCEDDDYTFELKRPSSQQLLIQFTSKDDVLASVEEIKTELIALVKLFQQAVISLGIKTLKVKPNWEHWTLTLTADTASLDKAAELLAEAGVKYITSLAEAKSALFYKSSTTTGRPVVDSSRGIAVAVTCRVQ